MSDEMALRASGKGDTGSIEGEGSPGHLAHRSEQDPWRQSWRTEGETKVVAPLEARRPYSYPLIVLGEASSPYVW